MATELGTGWIRIAADVSSIPKDIAGSIDLAQGQANKQGRGFGSKFVSGIGSVVTKTAAGVGIATGAALSGGMVKGVGRLTAIENAESKLTGLGNSARDVETIMSNALNSVKGTAYGLDSAATTAAMVVASGVKPGKELETVLKTVADTAGIAGASMDDMGLIFGSVAARGKLQGDDMLQLTSRGIPVLQMLADEMGTTAEEASDMVSKGKIDFETFESALRNNVGGAALEAGKTTQGSFANMIAASGRFGATLAGPFYNQAAGTFTAVTEKIDDMDAAVAPMVDRFDDWLGGDGIPKLKEWGATAKEATSAFINSDGVQRGISQTTDSVKGLVDAGAGLVPALVDVGSALGQASQALGIGGWQLFLTTLDTVSAVAGAVTPPLEQIAGFMEEHPNLVATAVAAWAGFKTVPGIVEKLTGALPPQIKSMGDLRGSTKDLATGVGDLKKYYADTGREIGTFDATMQIAATSSSKSIAAMGRSYSQASAPMKEFADKHRIAGAEAKLAASAASNGWDAADRMIAQAGHGITASVSSMAGTVTGVGKGAFTGMKNAATGLIDAMGGPLVVGLGAAVWAFNDASAAARAAEEADKAIAEASRDAASAQHELAAAVAGTNGQLDERGLAAAARIAKSELSELTELGGRKFSFIENMNQATVGLDNFMSYIPGMTTKAGRAQTELTQQAKETRQTYEALEEAAGDLGIPMSDLAEVAAEGGDRFDDLVGSLRNGDDASRRAADALEETHATVDQMVDSARKMDPAFAQGAAAIDVLSDSASNGQEKLNALEELMESMGLAPKMAEEALMDAAAAVDKIVESASNVERPVEELGDALFDMDGKLSPTNGSARELHDSLGTLRQEMEQSALAGNDANETLELMAPALQTLQDEFNLTEEQVEELRNSYGLLPDVINTAVNLEGAGETTQDLAGIWRELHNVPENKSIKVTALDEDAKRYLEELDYEIEELPDGSFEISGNTEEAYAALEEVINRMATIEGTDVDIELAMDDTEFKVTADQAQGLIDLLDIQEPTPHAQMIIDALQENNSIAMGDLASLDALSPTPTADIAKHLLDAGVEDANGKLDKLSKTVAEPEIKANTDNFAQKIGWVTRTLQNLPLTKTISIVGRTVGNWLSSNANGGQIPTRAAGGRLPLTGPGTHTTDGILGIGSDGQATAWVDRGEWVVKRDRSNIFTRTLAAINDGGPRDILNALTRELPTLGTQRTPQPAGAPGELQALAGGGVVGSITDIVAKHFPMMTITSTVRGTNDYHGAGKAVDFSNGTDSTPEMADAAKFFADRFGSRLLELIHSPFDRNIKNGKSVGTGFDFYGAQTMAQHRNHVHVAADAPLPMPSGSVFTATGEVSDSSDEVGTTSREMSWTNADAVDVSFGSADEFYKGISRAMGISERRTVQIGTTSESRASVTPGATDPLNANAARGTAGGWGHSFFVNEIARSAKARALPERGAAIGVGASYVEAGIPIKMWANRAVPDSLKYRHDAVGSDHDSVGIFQQRQSWGTLAQRMSPYDSAGMFFDAMLRKFPNWREMAPGDVAQGVQVSAFPDRYGKVMAQALEAVRNTQIYDQGGWLMPGGYARNDSRKPEPVFNGDQWGDLKRLIGVLPYLAGHYEQLLPVLIAIAQTGKTSQNSNVYVPEPLEDAALKLNAVAKQIKDYGDQAEDAFVSAGRQITAWTEANLTMFDNTAIVVDAERGLQQTRAQNAQDIELLGQAEKQLAEARDNLAKSQTDEAELSKTSRRKIEDAERKLAEARARTAKTDKEAASKAKAIADAERKLSQVREDAAEELKKSSAENAEAVIGAMDDVATAEQELENARENVAGITARTEAAERTLAAARIQVVSDIATAASTAYEQSFEALGAYIEQMSRFGGIVNETQQTVSRLAQEQVSLNLDSIKTANDLRIAEWDVSRARMEGAVDVALAEAALADARDGHLVMGATSVDSLGSAIDRFRELGLSAADELGTSIVVNTGEVRAAEAALAKARADAAVLELESENRAQAAAMASAKATLLQAQAAEVLAVTTTQLAQQTAQLNGMNNTQQTALQQRVTGAQKAGGGLLGILGGLAVGAIGVTTMNPALIAAGIGLGAKGISDGLTGINLLAKHDKKAADEAWDALPTGDKLTIGLGGAAAAVAGVAGIGMGVQTGNADWITSGLEAGTSVWTSTLDGMSERQQAAFDRIDAQYKDSMAAIDAQYSAQIAGMEAEEAAREANYLIRREALLAESAFQELEKRIAESSSKTESEALVRAAEVAAARRDDLLAATRETNELLKQTVNVSIPAGNAWTSDQLQAYLAELLGRLDGIEASVQQIDTQPTGVDLIMAQR